MRKIIIAKADFECFGERDNKIKIFHFGKATSFWLSIDKRINSEKCLVTYRGKQYYAVLLSGKWGLKEK